MAYSRYALIILTTLSAITGAIIEESTGTILFEQSVPVTRWSSPFATLRNQTIGVVTRDQFAELCEIDNPREWKRPDWPDTLILPEGAGEQVGKYCGGNIGTYAQGRYYKYWCNLSKTLVFTSQHEGMGSNLRNAKQHELAPPGCRTANARLNISMLEYLRETNRTVRVAIELEEDVFVAFDHWGFQLAYRGVFPCLYLFLLIQALHYGFRVSKAPTTLQKLSLAIIGFEVPANGILCISGFMYGSHFISIIPYDWAVFTYAEFFGPSCAADIILTIMYRESTMRVRAMDATGIEQRRAGVSVVIVVCFCLVALTATVLMFVIAYHPPSRGRGIILTQIVVPTYLTAAQGAVMGYLFWCTLKMRLFLTKATALVSDDMKDSCRKMERDLNRSANISIMSSFLNIMVYVTFGTASFRGNPITQGLLLLLVKVSRVGNTWARLQAVRAVIGDNVPNRRRMPSVLSLLKKTSFANTRQNTPEYSSSIAPIAGINTQTTLAVSTAIDSNIQTTLAPTEDEEKTTQRSGLHHY